MLPCFAVDLSDSQVAVPTRQVPAHYRHEFFSVARGASQRFHDVRDAEVLAKLRPLMFRSASGNLRPLGFGELPIDLHALRAQDLRVLCRGSVEDVEVAVQFPLEEPLGQIDRVGPGPDKLGSGFPEAGRSAR